MRTQDIQFGGDTFVCRIVKSNEGEDLLIGSTKLLDALHPAIRRGFLLHRQKNAPASGQRTGRRTQGEQSRMV